MRTGSIILLIEICFQLLFGMRITENKIAAALREEGYKLTPQRRAIIAMIISSHEHLTPADIYEKVHREYPAIGLVTVYRTIEVLARLGLLCEVHVGGSCRSYLIRRPPEHHHHLVCSGCGKVIDFTNCELDALEERLSQETGFKIHSHLLEFLGWCNGCQKMNMA